MIMLVEFLFKIDYLLFDMCKLTVLDALNLYSITYIHLLLEVFNMVAKEAKTNAIISYITIVGWVVALILNNQKKHEFTSYHIRQTLLLYIIWLVFSFIPIIGWLLNIGVLILWILGLISAINGEKKSIPIVGELAQKWFKSL